MEPEVKEVMDSLFQGRITIQEAAKTLNISEDIINKMIDEYEYVPTVDEILESNRIVQENLEYIKKEVFISYKRSVVPTTRPTDATELLEKVSEPEKAYEPPALDATGQITQRALITASSVGAPYPREQRYHW